MAGSIEQFKQLQGSVLLEVTVDYRPRVASLLLKAQSFVHLRLVADGVRTVVVPFEEPLGRKSSIENLRGPVPVTPGRSRMEVQLESGDVIAIEAAEFRLHVV